MNDEPVPPDAGSGQRAADTGHGHEGVGRRLMAGIAVLVVVVGLGLAWTGITEPFRPAEPAALDVRWETWQVRLEPGSTVGRARLRLRVPESSPSPGESGPGPVVSIGLPVRGASSSGDASTAVPADVLRLPRVHITVLGTGHIASSCDAPCEMPLWSGDLELLVDASDAGLTGPVMVSVGAGVVGRAGTPLPQGVEVRLEPAGQASEGG